MYNHVIPKIIAEFLLVFDVVGKPNIARQKYVTSIANGPRLFIRFFIYNISFDLFDCTYLAEYTYCILYTFISIRDTCSRC